MNSIITANKLLIQLIFRHPLAVISSTLLGSAGAIFNGIGTILIVPILLAILNVDIAFKKSLPPVLNNLFQFFDTIEEGYRLPAMIASVVGLLILKNLTSYLSTLASGNLNRKLSAGLRRDVLKVLLDADLCFYSSTRIGDHVSYLTTEVHRVTSAISAVIRLGINVLSVTAFVCMLILISWQLTIISVMVMGFVTLINQYLTKDAKRLGHMMTMSSKAFSNKAIEMISGIRLIKATANESREYQDLDYLIEERERLGYESQNMFALIGPTNEILN
ncbi:MAG: ABC transporter transmembrane domain-containing protein, partial [Cyanobacteria bacterium J06632_3]